MLTSEGDDQAYKLNVFKFAEYTSKNLTKIFFLYPSEILLKSSRINTITRLTQTFNI